MTRNNTEALISGILSVSRPESIIIFESMDPNSENLCLRARALVERLANGCENYNLGSATVSIYDTAWVSMIIKPTVGGDDEV